MTNPPSTAPDGATADSGVSALEQIAQWAEHFAFAAAACPADEDTIVALGNAFQSIAHMARAAEAEARS